MYVTVTFINSNVLYMYDKNNGTRVHVCNPTFLPPSITTVSETRKYHMRLYMADC